MSGDDDGADGARGDARVRRWGSCEPARLQTEHDVDAQLEEESHGGDSGGGGMDTDTDPATGVAGDALALAAAAARRARPPPRKSNLRAASARGGPTPAAEAGRQLRGELARLSRLPAQSRYARHRIALVATALRLLETKK
eukprot:362220-Chlamydomonas_euryale.AAC.6